MSDLREEIGDCLDRLRESDYCCRKLSKQTVAMAAEIGEHLDRIAELEQQLADCERRTLERAAEVAEQYANSIHVETMCCATVKCVADAIRALIQE